MQKIEARLTVFFEDPFWVGVCERIEDGQLEVCKITFGAEPKDTEVYEFLRQNWSKLRFSPSAEPAETDTKPLSSSIIKSPKRMRRAITKQLSKQGVGTKSQQALKLQQEEGKAARKKKTRLQKEEEEQMQFNLRQSKKKEKHRGH